MFYFQVKHPGSEVQLYCDIWLDSCWTQGNRTPGLLLSSGCVWEDSILLCFQEGTRDRPAIQSGMGVGFFLYSQFHICGYSLNSSTPISDWHLTSPYKIFVEPNIKIRRIKEMITHQTSSVEQILLVSPIGNVLRTVWRICILIEGCQGWRIKLRLLCHFRT